MKKARGVEKKPKEENGDALDALGCLSEAYSIIRVSDTCCEDDGENLKQKSQIFTFTLTIISVKCSK